MPRATLLNQRNESIYKEYRQLYREQRLQHQYILEILSGKYFIAPKTIEKIVLEQSKNAKAAKSEDGQHT